MFSDFNENWYLGLFWSEELIGNDENCIHGYFYFQNGRRQNRKIVNGLRFQWKLISRSILKWEIGWCPEFWYGVVWGLLCLHPNTIKPSYFYYYYYSPSSRRELVRPNSQRLMIRSLLNFTGRWIPISRGAFRSCNFQNGRRCHGNRERMSKSLTSLISETAEGISTRLGIYVK